jgi:hypothetical protein
MRIGRLKIKGRFTFEVHPWRSVIYEDLRRAYWLWFCFTWYYRDLRQSKWGKGEASHA